MIELINKQKFIQFHFKFKGDSEEIFSLCAKCGGLCEYNKIGTLLPGEKIYMAEMMKMNVKEFSDKYLDILLVDDEALDVLKFVEPCPFLNQNYECTCREFKVIMCEIYPIVFTTNGDEIIFSLDENCPLTNHKDIREYFWNVGIPAFKAMEIPFKWFKCVEKYDLLNFDYKKIQSKRSSIEKCEIFTLEKIIKIGLKSKNITL